MKTLSLLLFLLFPFTLTAQKWSEYTETLVLSNSWIQAVAVPGVTNYKFTIGTLVTNIASKISLTSSATNAVIGGRNLAITNATSFGVFYLVQGLTNMQFFNLKQGTNMVIYRDGSNIVLNATGTGGGGSTVALPLGSIQFNSNGVMQGSSDFLITNGYLYGYSLKAGTLNVAGPASMNYGYVSNYITMLAGPLVPGYVITDVAGDGTMAWQPPAVSSIDVSNRVRVSAGANVTVTPSGAGGIMTYTVASTGGGVTISNANLLFVDSGGVNATAKRGRRDLPFRDVRAAVAAAVAGDTVVVFPGIYTSNNIAKNGVNLYGYPGAILNYVDNGSGAGRGIIDDRDSGPVRMTIGGYFDIRYSTGLTGYNVGTINITPNPTNIVNIRGAICITNPLSNIRIDCSSICVTSVISAGTVAGVFVGNCAEFYLKCHTIFDPLGTNLFYLGDDDIGIPTYGASSMNGVWWWLGQTTIEADIISTASQAIYSAEPVGNTTPANLYVKAQHIENSGGQTTIYLIGVSPNYKVWIQAQDIISRGNAGAIGFYGQGRNYIVAEKIQAQSITILTTATGPSTNWVTAQKITSNQRWIQQEGGVTYVNAQHYEDDGAVDIGWNVSGGELIASGGQARTINAPGLVVSATGKARFSNVSIDTSAGNLLTNSPVVVSTNGVILQNCVLVAPTAAPAIASATSKSVLSYNGVTANKTNSPNITIQAGAFVVDSNVR